MSAGERRRDPRAFARILHHARILRAVRSTVVSRDAAGRVRQRQALVAQILRLDRQMVHALQGERPSAWLSVDLTMPQLKVLFLVSAAGSATAGELARGLGVSLSTITGIVDRLSDQGMVHRGEDPQDRRVTRITISDSGSALAASLHESSRARIERLLERLDDSALRVVEQALDLLLAAAGECAAPVLARESPMARGRAAASQGAQPA